MAKEMNVTSLHDYDDYKIREIQIYKMYEQKGSIV